MNQQVNIVNNEFHDKLFASMFKTNKDTFVFSPYSINFIMTMIYRGMDGVSKSEFEKVYNLPTNNDQLINDYISFDQRINHSQLKSANAQFVDKSYYKYIKPSFIASFNKAKYSFFMSDFVNSASKEKQIINTWVDGKTNHLIPELLSDDILNEDTKMVIVNTLYLKMKWQYPFEKYSSRPFKMIDGVTVLLPTMKHEKAINLKYFSNNNIEMVSLPYRQKSNDHYSMTILCCNKQFKPVANITNLFGRMTTQSVIVTMPKFTSEFETGLNNIYNNLGLSSIFREGLCDLSKMTSENDLFVSAIIHKAKIIVDEDGTEAAAATAVAMMNQAMVQPKAFINFVVDRAFQYSISHDESKTILFSGVYNG
jgi:serpin B